VRWLGCGCLALCGLPLLTVVVVLAVVGTVVGALFGASAPAGGGAYPTRCATGTRPTPTTASLRDLCHGPSDAARLARLIAAIRSDSPLVTRADLLVALGRRFGLDPLLIVQWQGESGMATAAPPVSANGPDNGGNLTWAAAEPYAAEWGCTPGATVSYPDGSYRFARCPSIEAGLGLWFAYVAGRYPAAAFPDLATYAETYNSCAYPGNAANGFLCGAAYARHILDLLAAHAGPPAFPDASGGSLGLAAVWGGGPTKVTQEFGDTTYSDGNPIYDYGREYGVRGHTGLDVGVAAGTPLFTPVAGTVVIAGGSGVFRDETGLHDPATSGELRLRLDNGDLLILGHLSAIAVGVGQRLPAGAPVGRSGTANGPHVHVEVRVVDRALPSGYRIVDPRPYLGE
jgi:murein DD-endopeptidase MepM/ murein hydrolase activator NlpD